MVRREISEFVVQAWEDLFDFTDDLVKAMTESAGVPGITPEMARDDAQVTYATRLRKPGNLSWVTDLELNAFCMW